MQVDFYHLTRDPAEQLVPILATKTLEAGKRLLVVSGFVAQLEKLSSALWQAGSTSFLAHGVSGSGNEENQPILISGSCEPLNHAGYLIMADGEWREEATKFERAFYLFTAENINAARQVWRDLAGRDGITTHYWRQDGGRWVKGP